MVEKFSKSNELIEYIVKAIPTQKKKIKKLEDEFPEIKSEIEKFFLDYSSYLYNNDISTTNVAQAYVEMIQQVVKERVQFLRTGRYTVENQQVAKKLVYDNLKVMKQYMLGLAISSFLWRHHYQILRFFRTSIVKSNKIDNILEIGSGHGLFCLEALARRADIINFDIFDISHASLQITKEILHNYLTKNRVQFEFKQINIMDESVCVERQYDWISMGEILEHVDNPQELLAKAASYLTKEGRIYISTCVNSPAIDHVYHFHSIQEIKELIYKTGLTVIDEIVAPAEDKDNEWLEKRKADISYAAILHVK